MQDHSLAEDTEGEHAGKGHAGVRGRLQMLEEAVDDTLMCECSDMMLDEVWGIWEASGPRYKDLQGLDPSDLFGSPHVHITSLLPHGTPLMTYHDSWNSISWPHGQNTCRPYWDFLLLSPYALVLYMVCLLFFHRYANSLVPLLDILLFYALLLSFPYGIPFILIVLFFVDYIVRCLRIN